MEIKFKGDVFFDVLLNLDGCSDLLRPKSILRLILIMRWPILCIWTIAYFLFPQNINYSFDPGGSKLRCKQLLIIHWCHNYLFTNDISVFMLWFYK